MAQQMNAYDTMIYARYPAEEAQARQDYDAACEAAENAQDRYEAALDTLIVMYESNQLSATIRKQKVVVELDRLDRNRAQREAEAARLRLERVQRELRAPVREVAPQREPQGPLTAPNRLWEMGEEPWEE